MRGPQVHNKTRPCYGAEDRPLRICLLSYRSNPHCGGQGVYIKNLSKALVDLGHHVDVVAGPPGLELDSRVGVFYPACLDLYNPNDLFRVPSPRELVNPINFMEWASVCTMGFPEPFTFGLRAFLFLRTRFHHYDIVHDNQSLSYGLLAIKRFIPTIATIHHPITIDRDTALKEATGLARKAQIRRWYSFVGMQRRVSRRLERIIAVSRKAQEDISREFGIPDDRFVIVHNGVNVKVFHPIPGTQKDETRIMVTSNSDNPLKGLNYLLRERKIESHGFINWASHYAHSLHTPYWWLKCVVGMEHNNNALVRKYQQFLEWDIMNKPRITRVLDSILNPVLGKSLVMYFKKVSHERS